LTLRGKHPYLLIALLIVCFDQASKFVVTRTVPLFFWKDVVRGFFRIWHVRNSGAVWGFLSDSGGSVPQLITLLAMAALAVVAFVFLKTTARCRLELTALSFILAGALGNIIDRVRLGYVVDFLDVYVGRQHWPTFNVADSFISIGVVLLAWSLWRGKCTPS
jgi:signal peptidase II